MHTEITVSSFPRAAFNFVEGERTIGTASAGLTMAPGEYAVSVNRIEVGSEGSGETAFAILSLVKKTGCGRCGLQRAARDRVELWMNFDMQT